MKNLDRWLHGLKNPVFAQLYAAQTINLAGDALTWLGLALLAFELAGEGSGTVLAGALTLRVLAFVLLSPIAGAIADRVDRQRLMIVTHIARMGIVCCLPFVTQVWQIYPIVLLLNMFGAFFSPTYTATIPLVTTQEERSSAIALSSATYQLLGVLGPGLAGSVAAFVGTRQVFFLDGITFGMAAIAIATLPTNLTVDRQPSSTKIDRIWADMRTGTTCLFADVPIRYALLMQLIAAIAGAQILVNTVNYVRGTLALGQVEYGWAMATFGIGATVAAVGLGAASRQIDRLLTIGIGAIAITLALLPANWSNLGGLLVLWSIAGIGQTLVNVPTQMLIADRVAVEMQGRVYGAQFAWSHLWWVFAYPLAGWIGRDFPRANFWYASLMGLGLAIGVYLAFRLDRQTAVVAGMWHEHQHAHDDNSHHHLHAAKAIAAGTHTHLHFHEIKEVH